MTPLDEIRAAAKVLRETVCRVPQGLDDNARDWEGRPWQVEACQDDCECIVYQGEYKPHTEPQIPPIQYVADAETPEHAAWIALMSPDKAEPVAALLEFVAGFCELTSSPVPVEVLTFAYSINGTNGDSS